MALLSKLSLGIFCAIAALLLVPRRSLLRANSRRFRRLLALLFLATRLGPYLLLYVVFAREPISDVANHYVPQALAATRGEVVYRDFASSYGPLFPYIGSLLLLAFNSGKAFVLFAITTEALGLLFWGKALREGTALSEDQIRGGELLYVLSPVAISILAISGQQQSWLTLGLALSTWLTVKQRAFRSGLVLALTLLSTKILALLFFAPLLISLRAEQRWRFILSFMGIVGASLLTLAYFEASPLGNLQTEVGTVNPANLPSLIRFIGVRGLSNWLPLTAVMLGVALSSTFIWRQHPKGAPILGVAVSLTIFMLFGSKTLGAYLLFASLPIFAFIPHSKLSLILWSLGQLAYLMESSMHNRWLKTQDLAALPWSPTMAIVLATNILIVGAASLVLFQLLKSCRRSDPARLQSPQSA